jgi:hypothetical protein
MDYRNADFNDPESVKKTLKQVGGVAAGAAAIAAIPVELPVAAAAAVVVGVGYVAASVIDSVFGWFD